MSSFYRVLHPCSVWISPSFTSKCIFTGAKKGPGEIVEVIAQVQVQDITFYQLAIINGWIPSRDDSNNVEILEKLEGSNLTIRKGYGEFYYRVNLSINVREGPDILSPVMEWNEAPVTKAAGEIIQCCQTLQLPQSRMMFVKLSFREGWLFDRLPDELMDKNNQNMMILTPLTSTPDVVVRKEHGRFFYLVKIPVGVRSAPNIMAKRTGKGYKRHTVLEGDLKLMPPGSSMCYIQLTKAHGGGFVFETTMDGQQVLEPFAHSPDVYQTQRRFYRLCQDIPVVLKPDIDDPRFRGSSFSSSQHSSISYDYSDASSPSSTPRRNSSIVTDDDNSCPPYVHHIRSKDTIVECTEWLVPYQSKIGYYKLRHDDGWMMDMNHHHHEDINSSSLEHIDLDNRHETERTKMTEARVFYQVVVNQVAVRLAPDFESPTLSGLAPKTKGAMLETSIQYTPPGRGNLTYVKLRHEHGWLFTTTPDGHPVLRLVQSHHPSHEDDTKADTYRYYHAEKHLSVYRVPDRESPVIETVACRTVFGVHSLLDVSPKVLCGKLILFHTLEDNGPADHHALHPDRWVFLSTERNTNNVVQVSRELYDLFCCPPKWRSIGFPIQTWVKLPQFALRLNGNSGGGSDIHESSCSLQLEVSPPDEEWWRENSEEGGEGQEFLDEISNIEGQHVDLVQETLLQSRLGHYKTLRTSSQGAEDCPVVRRGHVSGYTVRLEELKHPASNVYLTYPWKQLWWVFTPLKSSDNHNEFGLEVQHSLKGGYRRICCCSSSSEGQQVSQVICDERPILGLVWDSGSSHEFDFNGHHFHVNIELQGSFLSTRLQYYTYSVTLDEEEIQLDLITSPEPLASNNNSSATSSSL